MKFDFLENIAESVRNFFRDQGFACDACGKELFEYPKIRLCQECAEKMRYNDGRICPKCGRKTLAEGVCLSCKSRLPRFSRGISPFVYRGETAGLINRVKNGTPTLAYYFAECMAKRLVDEYPSIEQFRQEEGTEPLLFVAVPLTKERLRERGFNQAEELAKTICLRLQEAGYFVCLESDLLEKKKDTAQQKHMGYQARRKNVEGAYHVHKRKVCQGRTIVLVDDIMTTGATGSECAARLLGAGAKEVIFLVAASLPELK